MNTIYRPVPDYADLYASLDGSIVKAGVGELKQKIGAKGYLYVSIPGIRGTVESHRLIAAAFLGKRPPGYETRHGDGNKVNNDLSNFSYGTHQQNMQDAIAHGRHAAVHNMAKTECPQGHKYDEKNTYRPPGTNRRVCRKCKRDNEIKRSCQ